MKFRLWAAAAALMMCWSAEARPVLMISVDGLRPLDVIEADKRGLKVPTLKSFIREGAYASGVRNVLPTVTYPDHTTLITGVWPAVHGIANNTTFDPENKNLGGWYWYSSDIKVPTLWDVVHGAGKPVASIGWPVSVGNPSIDYDIPEYWRAGTMDDLKLINALSQPYGIGAVLSGKSGIPLVAAFGEEPRHDVAKAKLTAALIELKKPELVTLHLNSVDGEQHMFGPGTPKAHEAIETVDAAIGELIAVARKAEPDVVVAIVSDHGFADVHEKVNLLRHFISAGLVQVDAANKIVSWQAMPWNAGGSSLIVLANSTDEAVKNKVKALLDTLVKDPKSGVAKVIGAEEIAAMGGNAKASFFVDYKLGYYGDDSFVVPVLAASKLKGTHGYFPTHPEMRATFMIKGPGIAHKALGEIDMRDIAPTLAQIMNVSLPTAMGKPLPVEK